MLLDSQLIANLTSYLQLKARDDCLSFLPRGASDITVVRINRLSGGISNDNYSFKLTFVEGNSQRMLMLILKVYRRNPIVKCKGEGQILNILYSKGFKTPKCYVQELDSTFLGAPFIIMSKIDGIPFGRYLKSLDLNEQFEAIQKFAEALFRLHNLSLTDSELSNFEYPSDENAYTYHHLALIKNLMSKWQITNFESLLNLLEEEVLLHPCKPYSILHGDMHLDNFLITTNGDIFFIDWEYPEVGDPLKDVGLVYHNLLMFNTLKIKTGERLADYFINAYCSHSKVNYSTLRFYLLSTAILESLSYQLNASKSLNPFYVKQVIGLKFLPAFPLVWLLFRYKALVEERFIYSIVNNKLRN